MSGRQFKFFSAIAADFVGPTFDGEHAAHVSVTTANPNWNIKRMRIHGSQRGDARFKDEYPFR
jgi:hypothetical protein